MAPRAGVLNVFSVMLVSGDARAKGETHEKELLAACCGLAVRAQRPGAGAGITTAGDACTYGAKATLQSGEGGGSDSRNL